MWTPVRTTSKEASDITWKRKPKDHQIEKKNASITGVTEKSTQNKTNAHTQHVNKNKNINKERTELVNYRLTDWLRTWF